MRYNCAPLAAVRRDRAAQDSPRLAARRWFLHLRYRIAAALTGILLSAARLDAAVLLPTGFANDTLLTGLDEPNSMAFLPDGRVLITETRTGKVRLFVNDHIAASDPVLTVPDLVASDIERGLQGVAVDPGWPARPWVYLYYTR